MKTDARSAQLLLIALTALFAMSSALKAEEEAFTEGERLIYSIKWGIIKAGTAVLEVHPVTEVEGEEAYHFSLTIQTTPFVDNFYTVRDRIDGFARTDLQSSLLYLVEKTAGKNLRDVRVTYDPVAGVAQYSNFGTKRDPVEITADTLDPLSVVYALRLQELNKGDDVELAISDGKRSSIGVGRVRKTETVKVPAGKYKAILVEPDMKDVGGVFEKSGDSPIQMWFSDDDRRLPIRISSRVTVGSFRADLVSIEQVSAEELAALTKASAE